MVEGRSHARMGTFEVPPAALDEVVALFRDRVVPAFSRHDGFLGYEAAALGALTVGTPRILALAFDSRVPIAGRA